MANESMKNSVFQNILMALLKVILFLLLLGIFFVIGLFIGYVLLGKGNYWEVLNQDTWQHILDFLR